MGLTPFQIDVLNVLSKHPAGLDLHDLTRKVAVELDNGNIGCGTVGGALKRLLQSSLVVKSEGLWLPVEGIL